jgi:hypothetical protein
MQFLITESSLPVISKRNGIPKSEYPMVATKFAEAVLMDYAMILSCD